MAERKAPARAASHPQAGRNQQARSTAAPSRSAGSGHPTAPPQQAGAESLLFLQRHAGNQAVSRLVEDGDEQAPPADRPNAEQETADSTTAVRPAASDRPGGPVVQTSLERGPAPAEGPMSFFGVNIDVDAGAIRAQLRRLEEKEGWSRVEFVAAKAGFHRSMLGNRQEIYPGLDALLDQFKSLNDERKKLLEDFEKAGIAYLIAVCNQSEKVLEDELIRYGLAYGDGKVKQTAPTMALVEAVRILIEKRDRAEGLGYEATVESEGYGIGPSIDDEPADDIGSDTEGGTGEEGGDQHAGPAAAAQEEFEALRAKTVAEFPILRTFMDPARSAELEAMQQPYFQEKLGSKSYSDELTGSIGREARQNLKKIRSLRDDATSGEVKVWQLPLLVEATKAHLGFLPDTYRARVVTDRLKQHDDSKTVSTLLLSALALALGIVGALPTGGMSLGAAGAVLAAGVGSVAVSGVLLADTVETFGLEHHASVVEMAEDPSTFGLLLELGLSMFDLGGLVKVAKVAKPTLAAAKSVTDLRISLKNLVPGAEGSRELLRKSIAEMGVNKTLDVSGRSIEDLVQVAGDDQALVARLWAASDSPVSMDQVKFLIRDLATASASRLPEVGEALARAIDVHGALPVLRQSGGWKQLVSVLGDSSPASKRLMAWRDEVVGGALTEFGQTLPRGSNEFGLVRTGTTGSPSNDFDWSALGARSSANRDAAFHFLEARFGLSRKEVQTMLHGDLFTDPRRLHLVDDLEPELREKMSRVETEHSEKLLYNRMLHEAKQRKGTEALQASLIDQMGKRGLGEPGYVEMGAGDLARLSTELDKWHVALENATTYQAREELVTKIGRAQAEINAIEKGGYLTGGGAAGFAQLPDVDYKALTKPQRYGAALDHVLKLAAAMDEFDQLSKEILDATNMGRLAEAIKKIGKYGARLNTIAGDGLFSPISDDMLATLARFGDALDWEWKPKLMSDLADQARSGAVLRKLGSDAPAVIEQTRHAIRDLMDKQDDFLTALRVEAGMYDVVADATPLIAIQKAMIVKLRLQRVWDLLKGNLNNIAQAASAAEDHFSEDPSLAPPAAAAATSG